MNKGMAIGEIKNIKRYKNKDSSMTSLITLEIKERVGTSYPTFYNYTPKGCVDKTENIEVGDKAIIEYAIKTNRYEEGGVKKFTTQLRVVEIFKTTKENEEETKEDKSIEDMLNSINLDEEGF